MEPIGVSLAQMLAAAPPAQIAVRYGAQAVTYGEIERDSLAVATHLHALGLRAGDRIAVWLPNIPAWLVLLFACARLGAIVVAVNTRFRSHEVADIVGRSACRVLVVWPNFKAIDFAGILAAVPPTALAAIEHVVVYGETPGAIAQAMLPGVALSHWDDLLRQSTPAPMPGTAADRCVIFTTSGTTKAPKFVCHLQQTVVAHARDVAAALGLVTPGALLLQALPLCGVFGFTQALAAIVAAVPMRMLSVFDAAEAAAWVREEGVTHMNGVDDMIDRMLAVYPDQRPFPTLRHFGYALFNPALDNIVLQAQRRGVSVRGLYGMSECQAFYALQPLTQTAAERRKGGGLPVSSAAQVRVRDPATGTLVAAGVQGELEISGPSLMHEYFNDPAATAATLTADGYLRTGDLGYLESDGRFCYVARMGDVLRLGGFLTSPLEIEAVLDAHPAVVSSQVVAIDIGGAPTPVAFVLPAAGRCDELAIIEFCRARLAGYKVPRRVFMLAAFPTTLSANGTKIQKSRLRELAVARLAAAVNDAINGEQYQ